jgi:hypothetical protein
MMGAFAMGTVALYYGVAKWLGMDDEEIKKRFNPANPTFLLWKINVAEGRNINIGPGGVFRGFLRLMGNMVKTSVENPGNWKSLTSEKNPIVKWHRGHAGPLVGAGWDAFTGKDFLGREYEATDLPRKVLPLGAEEFIRPEGEKPATAVEVAGQFLGATQFPARESYGEKVERVRKELYPKVESLAEWQRARIHERIEKEPTDRTLSEQKRMAQYATEKQFDRLEKLQLALPVDMQFWLSKHNLQLRGFDLTLSGGVPMNEKEKELYPDLIRDEYVKILRSVVTSDTTFTQERLDDWLTTARARAKSRLTREVK